MDFTYQIKGLEVQFKLTESVGTSVCTWDFGDGDISFNETNPTHTYRDSGFYIVTLKVSPLSGEPFSVHHTLPISDKVKTHLPDTIYNLINNYIPHEISNGMSQEEKSVYINKWQLYIGPLVNRPEDKEIPIEEYNNEGYYEGLENQLVMELAAFDYLQVKITNLLIGTGEYLRRLTTAYSSYTHNEEKEVDPAESTRGDRIKKITTGPTEVEYYDTVTESTSSTIKAWGAMLQPGGVVDELRKNLCMLANRVSIIIPFCDQPYHPVIPKVVDRRYPGFLGGPNPRSVLTDPHLPPYHIRYKK